MSIPNYCLIFHANINYAFLTPDKYEFDNQPLNKDIKPYWDNKMAWHRTFADAWANVKTAKEELDPLCDKVRAIIKKADAESTSDEDRAVVRDA